MIPDERTVGVRGTVPESFKLRLLRYHLDPERGLGEAQWFTRATAEDGTLEWIVESSPPDHLRLRLEGRANLRREGGRLGPTAYMPMILGYLTYDIRKDRVAELKMIALGDVLNTPRGVRPGLHPLGIAFELVSDPRAAERVVPRGGRDDVERYLNVSSR
jgi:hypothetical protein